MNWWLNRHANGYVERVSLTMNVEASLSTGTKAEDFALENRYQRFVWLHVRKLVTQIIRKTDMAAKIGEPEKIIKVLFKETLFQIGFEEIELNVSKNFDKVIFKELCRKCGGPDTLMMLLLLNDPGAVEVIASSFWNHLLREKKQKNNIIYRCFQCHRQGILYM